MLAALLGIVVLLAGCVSHVDAPDRSAALPLSNAGAATAALSSTTSRLGSHPRLHRLHRPHRPPRGTDAWRLERPALGRQIEGFTTQVSGLPGQPVTLKVATTSETYRVIAYRIGGYRAGSGRRIWTSPVLGARDQPPATFETFTTRTVVAPWHPSLAVPTVGWPEGFYLFKLVTDDGWQALVPYVVRSRVVAGKVVLVAPVTTWQAYNDWGGYSLYTGPAGDRRAWAVSLDRPYPAPGAGQMLFGVVPVAVLAERAGLPLAYLADTDLDTSPDALRDARAFVSLGHDEYWSPAKRRAVLRARDSGTNLAFLGANTMYWKVRLEPTGTRASRVVVGYRSDATLDPVRLTSPRDATGLFREDRTSSPESSVTGMDYECFPVDEPYRVVSPHWWGFRGTHVRQGTEFPHLVGVEADRVYPVATTPRPLQILADVDYSCGGVATSAQSVYYTTASGAGVFNAGTLRWTCALTGGCRVYQLDRRTVRFTRQVTTTVLRAFAAGPAGRLHPALDNVSMFALPTVNEVPAS